MPQDNKQKTKVYKDKKEFDEANQAYNDSLFLYNASKNNFDFLNSKKAALKNEGVIKQKGHILTENDYSKKNFRFVNSLLPPLPDDFDNPTYKKNLQQEIQYPEPSERYDALLKRKVNSFDFKKLKLNNPELRINPVNKDFITPINYNLFRFNGKLDYGTGELNTSRSTKSLNGKVTYDSGVVVNKDTRKKNTWDMTDEGIGIPMFKKPVVKPVYQNEKISIKENVPVAQEPNKPKLEAIKPLGIKPINTFIQPKLAGNIVVPEIPKSNPVVQNYTAAKQLEKMKKPTGYVNQGNNTGRQEFQQGGQLGSTLGSIGGMALGSIIAPGVGTTIGGMLGGKAGNFVQNQFMEGGPLSQVPENNKLVDIKGNPHSKGGVTLANGKDEVQGKETIVKYKDSNGQKQSFVLSNDIMYNKIQSLADKSRANAKKYFRDNDPIDAKARELGDKELIEKNLTALNDNNMNYNSFMMYGGKLKKKYILGGGLNLNHPMSDDRENIELRKKYEGLTTIPSKGLTNINNDLQIAGKIQAIPDIPKTPNISNYENPLSNKPNYGNIIPQLAGDVFNIAQGLKGGDPVDFQRVNPYLASPKSAVASMNNTTSTLFNSAKNAIRNSATSSGEYLAQMNSLAGAASLKRGVGIAGIKAEYDKMNTGIMNQTSFQNAGIQMQEADARQRETDAARSTVSKGLSDLGSKIGSINNEKSSRNNQKDLVSLMSKNGYKLTRDANGELGFEKNGTYTPWEVAIQSVFK